MCVETQITAPSLNQVLRLGDVLDDTSDVGKMRDIYAIRLFTVDNAMICMQHDEPVQAVYVMVLALAAHSLRGKGMTVDERFFMQDSLSK